MKILTGFSQSTKKFYYPISRVTQQDSCLAFRLCNVFPILLTGNLT